MRACSVKFWLYEVKVGASASYEVKSGRVRLGRTKRKGEKGGRIPQRAAPPSVLSRLGRRPYGVENWAPTL